ncbi:hypothetical protein P5G65_04595 [Paenibacillus chondroitinus]|uniref:Uncharacterized protein n=1 Tax=Paenibacillus chondroitinus TaxID=59842 RepID=A0ABU6D618_9BACL|nr:MULTISPECIES: hypothetical protein [Paenibacillus]MEB4793163.1 hypothetical protein [Paenibacillus chondroitinus]
MKDENTNKENEELLFKHELALKEGIMESKSKLLQSFLILMSEA